ncbi:TRAP transporter small permease [Rhodocyclus purpureus]|uniref:TRAP transporter small permease n=1 Tax=Rhodocyclus purpureus TaxID=1067 RepID=UPI001912224F|nr:TRAP transporter small permease [Rhodocyclus purpureus]MBK5915789.1 TRAP transporter permease DctQ [Rhodocyclus purpureus]
MKWLDHLEEWIVTFLMAAATTIIFVAVVHRYLAGVDIPGVQDWLLSLNFSWAQELCIIMFVWMAKFGAAYGVRTGIHVGVDVLINRLDERKRRVFIVFGLLAGALFTGIIATLGANFVWENGAHYAFLTWSGADPGDVPEGPTTPDLEWPTWIVYSAIPLGSSLMCFRFLQVNWNFLRTGDLPHHDHGHVEGLEEEQELAQMAEKDGASPVDFNHFAMQDDLHPRDLKHPAPGGAEPDKQQGGERK